jgi:hypothetical protein
MELLFLKVALVAACAVGLLVIARFLSRASDNQILSPQLVPLKSEPGFRPGPRPVPRVGRELPFPFDIRGLEVELAEKYGPDFFRPKILNYYFLHTDLEAGPDDPTNFYDDFHVEFENPENGQRWTSSFWVTTPAGLSRQIDENRQAAVWGSGTLVVKRFDLKVILRSILESYADHHAADKAAEVQWEQNQSRDDIG